MKLAIFLCILGYLSLASASPRRRRCTTGPPTTDPWTDGPWTDDSSDPWTDWTDDGSSDPWTDWTDGSSNPWTDWTDGSSNPWTDWSDGSSDPTGAPVTTDSPNTDDPDASCNCGQVNRVLRIVGGEETEVNEYPWQVAVMLDGGQWCGGSVVSESFVITAAHCTDYPTERYSFRFGAHHISDTSVVREASKIIDHPNYNPKNFTNDISVVVLKEKVELGPKIGRICLPSPQMDYSGKTAVVSGWGRIEYGGNASPTLLETTVKVMTNAACQTLTNGPYGQYGLTDDMVCAYGDGERDACQGDSGGPMVVEVNGHYDLVGVVSWGTGCAEEGYPGVYSRVTSNLVWVKKQIQNSGNTCTRQ